MKITIPKTQLLKAALPAAGFSSNRETIAAIEGILFRTVGEDQCELCAYDLEKGMKTTVSCTVEEEGSGVINCSRFLQIVRAMPDGDLTVDIDERSLRVTITGGKAVFELQAIGSKDFPDLPELRGDRGFSIGQGVLRSILQKTQFAIAVDNVRPELNGLNLKGKGQTLTAVSCDGSRLALYEETLEIKNLGSSELAFDIILPGKTIGELMRFLSDSEDEVKVFVARKHAVFFIGSFTLFTRLIDAQYIDYERFLPKAPKIFVTAATAAVNGALERALLVTEDRQQGQVKSPVICKFEGGVFTVSSSSITGRVCDAIPAEQEGEDLEIGFNCRLLSDAVKVCDEEKIKLSLTSPLSAMTIEPVGGEKERKFVLLVLPVRLNK